MIALLLGTAAAVIKSRQTLILENLALRHQIGVLRRSVKQPRLRASDRGLWVLLSRKDCPETRPVEPPHLGVIRAEPIDRVSKS